MCSVCVSCRDSVISAAGTGLTGSAAVGLLSTSLSGINPNTHTLPGSMDGMSGLANFPCISWRKFVMLTEVLDYSLYDIAEALSTNKCNCFTSKEMTKLIIALFEDTPKRQALLDSIKQVQL